MVRALLGAPQLALMVKNPPADAGDVGKIPWRRAWQPALAWGIPRTEEAGGLHVHRVTKSQT